MWNSGNELRGLGVIKFILLVEFFILGIILGR